MDAPVAVSSAMMPPSTSPVFHCSAEGHHPEAPEMLQTHLLDSKETPTFSS